MKKITWGKATLKFCPTTRKVWQLDKNNNIVVHKGMPSYGLESKEIPQEYEH